MFSSVQTAHAERIAGWIVQNKLDVVKARDLMRNYKPFAQAENKSTMSAVMERLVLVNWLEPEVPDVALKPIRLWRVNPAVHKRFASYAEREV